MCEDCANLDAQRRAAVRERDEALASRDRAIAGMAERDKIIDGLRADLAQAKKTAGEWLNACADARNAIGTARAERDAMALELRERDAAPPDRSHRAAAYALICGAQNLIERALDMTRSDE